MTVKPPRNKTVGDAWQSYLQRLGPSCDSQLRELLREAFYTGASAACAVTSWAYRDGHMLLTEREMLAELRAYQVEHELRAKP